MRTKKIIQKELRQRRVFSQDIRKAVVHDIETGKCTVSQASSELAVSSKSIYRWIHQYSRYLKSNKVLVVEEKSEAYRTKELEKRLKELEAVIGRKQMEIDFLNKLIEIAEKETGTSIKKNSSTPPWDGSGPTKTNNIDMP